VPTQLLSFCQPLFRSLLDLQVATAFQVSMEVRSFVLRPRFFVDLQKLNKQGVFKANLVSTHKTHFRISTANEMIGGVLPRPHDAPPLEKRRQGQKDASSPHIFFFFLVPL
jgi:hypothetical protein